MVSDTSGIMERLERWIVLGDGLTYRILIVPDTSPLSADEIICLCRCDNAVITIFDALTGEFIGMAYANKDRPELEVIRYGRRKGDIALYAF
jgi:hypothetical protein